MAKVVVLGALSEGCPDSEKPFVEIEYTSEERKGDTERVDYDYLVNATGPKLNFDATEGLGPGKFTHSVCSCDHATATWEALKECFFRMEKGEKVRFLIGTGHWIKLFLHYMFIHKAKGYPFWWLLPE